MICTNFFVCVLLLFFLRVTYYGLCVGQKYASYGARFEGRIVQKLIQADGGKGDFEEVVSPMLGIWDTLLKGNVSMQQNMFAIMNGVRSV